MTSVQGRHCARVCLWHWFFLGLSIKRSQFLSSTTCRFLFITLRHEVVVVVIWGVNLKIIVCKCRFRHGVFFERLLKIIFACSKTTVLSEHSLRYTLCRRPCIQNWFKVDRTAQTCSPHITIMQINCCHKQTTVSVIYAVIINYPFKDKQDFYSAFACIVWVEFGNR